MLAGTGSKAMLGYDEGGESGKDKKRDEPKAGAPTKIPRKNEISVSTSEPYSVLQMN